MTRSHEKSFINHLPRESSRTKREVSLEVADANTKEIKKISDEALKNLLESELANVPEDKREQYLLGYETGFENGKTASEERSARLWTLYRIFTGLVELGGGIPVIEGSEGAISKSNDNDVFRVKISPWSYGVDGFKNALNKDNFVDPNNDFTYDDDQFSKIKKEVEDMEAGKRFQVRFEYKDGNGEYKEAAFDYDECIGSDYLYMSGNSNGEHYSTWQQAHHPGFTDEQIKGIKEMLSEGKYPSYFYLKAIALSAYKHLADKKE